MAESLLNTPILWINTYLQETLNEEFGFTALGNNSTVFPFFPTGPSTIELLNNSIVEDVGVMAVWDRMFRMRRSSFPHIKTEQVLYYFYSTGSDYQLKMVRIQEQLLRLFDREDESAQEINKWQANRDPITVNGEALNPKFYFHRFKVYHLEEARDIVDFGTARTYAGNKIIIDYEYHQMTPKVDSEGNVTSDGPLTNTI
jgi:hypothetical protein